MPGVQAMCKVMSNAGYTVEVFTINNVNYTKSSDSRERIIFHYMPGKYSGIKKESAGRLSLAKYVIWLFHHRKSMGSLNLGIGLKGGGVALIVKALLRRRYIYYSMELYECEGSRSIPSRFKAYLERLVCNHAERVLIQDLPRAEILTKFSRIDISKILIFPNSYASIAYPDKSTFLRDELGISSNKKILLYIGALSDTCRVMELVTGFANCVNDDWVLVINSKWDGHDKEIKAYIDNIVARSESGRIFLRTTPLPFSELPNLISSADIGIALYSSDSENVNNVGLSSGKIAHYLECCLPVILSNQQSLRLFVDNPSTGVSIQHIEELPQALATIISEYSSYQENARQFYNKHFSINKYSDSVLRALSDLVF